MVISMKDSARIKWLWGKTKGYHKIYMWAIITTVIYSVMQLTVAMFSQNIVDTFFNEETGLYNLEHYRTKFFLMVFGMVALTFVRTNVVYRSCMLYEKVSQHVLCSVRTDLFHRIQHQDMRFYDKFRTGDLMTRLTGDIDSVRHTLAWTTRVSIDSLVLFLTVAGYFIYLNAKVALCVLAVSPLLLIITILFKRKVGPQHSELREQLSQMNTATQENIAGNRIVKAFAKEEYEIKKFEEKNKAYSKANKKTIITQLTYFPLIEICANGLTVILLLVGGLEMIHGNFTVGQYVGFSCLTWAIAGPMRNLSNIFNEFQRFAAASEKVMELEECLPTIVNPEKPVETKGKFKGEVEFRDISFSYGDNKVLDKISFTAKPGQTIAIMGETGSGKTSLINLIPRFYDPDAGEVLVDGVNICEYRLEDLRKNIGYAAQDILLYSDTIDGNIAFGDLDMSEEKVKKYAKLAAAEEFILKLPQKYDTIIGERGVGLSGGQKQRISLARALAIEPSILILDDTTSAVDLETEQYIQKSLDSLEFNCTKFIIAQRISSTKNADLILYLKDGKIAEMGTHEQLLALKQNYYDIYCLQMGGEDVG